MLLLERVAPAVTHPPLQPAHSSRPVRHGVGALSRPRVLLASRSPRRRLLLQDAGIDHDVIESGVDDGHLAAGGVAAEQWVIALAYLKAAAAMARITPDCGADHAVVLGADTVVVDEGEIIGQPADRADAERILRRLSGGEHDVLTGVALIDPRSGRRDLFLDRAHVTVGPIPEAGLAEYLDSGHWRGKAGAYNLAERLDAGWPITVQGDPGTVMGLPMNLLLTRLDRLAR